MTIAASIAIERAALPASLDEAIRAALSVRNPDKDRAISERIQGAKEMPDKIALFAEDEQSIFIPRGFAHKLETLAREHEVELSWERHMTLYPPSQRCFADWPEVELRGYQLRARDEMLDWANGIFRGPTGSGKTRVALEVARWAGQPTLIIVDKTALAKQWATVIKESYGFEAGLVGEGVWNEQSITVALRQTLWSRRETTPTSFYSHWGMLILDEVHHASSDTLVDLVQRFPAFYRLGYSATPEWDELLFPLVEAVVGPVVHRTTAADVGENLVKPSVVVLPTSFEAEYRPTKMQGNRRISNNYQSVVQELCADPERNWLIAKTAIDDAVEGHHVLITTRRIEHVRLLVDVIYERLTLLGADKPALYVLTGAQSLLYERYREAIATSQTGTILISTIADEALDIPRLDRLVLAFPVRRVPLVEQQIGRIVRPSKGKDDAIVYDLVDSRIGVLNSQHRERMQQLYLRRRWPVDRRELAVTA